jgi:radical SAM protein with 4Fe4S-binding SPASM domain
MFGIKTRIKKYLTGRYASNRLTHVRISPVGYLCNHACLMCWRLQLNPAEKSKQANGEVDHLTVSEYSQLIVSLPKSVEHVEIVGGGEPLLFPHLEDVCKQIKQKNIHGRLITNGSLLKEDVIKNLIIYSWDEIRISFHAGSAKVYKKVNGADDFFKVINNIRLLLKLRKNRLYPKISLLYVIQKDNYKDINAFAQLAELLAVDEIEFDYLIPTNIQHLLLNLRQTRKVIQDLKKVQKTTRIKNNAGNTVNMFKQHPLWRGIKDENYYRERYCQIVQHNIDISSTGDVAPCCIADDQLKYGNIRNTPISVVWENSRLFRKDMLEGKFKPFCYSNCNYNLARKS